MFWRSVPRLAAALALAAVLAAAVPAAGLGLSRPGAGGRGESWIESVWDWMAGVWEGVLPIWANGGIEIDPNGAPRSQPSGRCDSGIEIDPLGCPARPQGDSGIEIDPLG